MKNLLDLINLYGEKEVILKILKLNLSRKKKWELIKSDLIHKEINSSSFDKEEKELEFYNKRGINFITFLDENYPEPLKNIYDPPIALFYKGKLKKDFIGVSIVGTRRCSDYGRFVSEELSSYLVKYGVVVISGLAYGIDTYAHIGALKGGGETYAVLGSGLNIIYPSKNLTLSKKIEENGALISEYFPDEKPRDYHFPERNRIIAGLSKAVVLVEAPIKSGALITVDFAIDFGREVFSVPGQINSEKSEGCHKIIKDGANILCKYSDILELLNIKPKDTPLPILDEDEKRVLEKVPYTITYIDDIIESSKDLSILVSLESKGLIQSFPGNFYIRKRIR
ncbi:MAG: DNA-processing protein DprA [Caldisericia bacterium]|jgi:DNA processing protein|nr:DNA-processing protein DprA [Caldisericia bacterium]